MTYQEAEFSSAVQPLSPVPDLANPETRRRLSRAAADGMVRLAAIWGLKNEEASAMAGLSDRTWSRLKKGDVTVELSQDVLTRISILTGVFKGLHIVFSRPLADEWVRLPNRGPLFGGQRPVEAMTRGGIPTMMDVRRHVDALRGGL